MKYRYSRQHIDDISDWVEDLQDHAGNPSPEEERFTADERQEKSFHTAPSDHPPAHAATFFFGEDDIFSSAPKVTKKNLWSIVWSDLMMTMFIYFALMYIFSSLKPQASTAGAEPAQKSISHTGTSLPPPGRHRQAERPASIPDLYALSVKTIKAGDLNRLASVDLVPDRAVRIVLTGDLLFDLGKAELKDDARQQLRALAPLVSNSSYLVNVVGHTDDLPIRSPHFSSNWELSVMRACVVARFFIEEMGIPESRFYLSGYASLQPAKPNISGENRAANRRVELIITRDRPRGNTPGDELLPADLV